MAECKNCGKKFHACSSCSLDCDWQNEYCCQDHWHQSDEYQEEIDAFKRFCERLDQRQRTYFCYFVEKFYDDCQGFELDEFLKNSCFHCGSFNVKEKDSVFTCKDCKSFWGGR